MPETMVGAIIIAPDTAAVQVLLTRRNTEPFKGEWCLPGGHIDRYEPAEQAIVREVKEETGLDFDARFFGYFDEIIPERGIHAVVLAFVGYGTGSVSAQRSEVSDIAWFTLDETRSMSLAFSHSKILDAYAIQTGRGEESP